MNKAELVIIVDALTPSSITVEMLNKMTVVELEGLRSHFTGGGVAPQLVVEEKTDYRPGYLAKTREVLKGSCGVEVIPELKQDRYLVVVVDTQHRRTIKDGSKSKKQISQSKYHRISFGKFKDGNVAPAWQDPKSEWNLTPVLDLGDGTEIQIEVNATVCDHDKQYDTK